MRFFGFSATAIAAVALLQGACASPQDSYASVTSATQTVTLTRTVSRVVATEYATRNATSTTSMAAPTGVIPPYAGGNGTASLTTGVMPPASTSSPYTGAATKFGAEALAAAALAGMIGLLAI